MEQLRSMLRQNDCYSIMMHYAILKLMGLTVKKIQEDSYFYCLKKENKKNVLKYHKMKNGCEKN